MYEQLEENFTELENAIDNGEVTIKQIEEDFTGGIAAMYEEADKMVKVLTGEEVAVIEGMEENTDAEVLDFIRKEISSGFGEQVDIETMKKLYDRCVLMDAKFKTNIFTNFVNASVSTSLEIVTVLGNKEYIKALTELAEITSIINAGEELEEEDA